MISEDRGWHLRLGYLIHDVSRLRRICFDRDLAPLGITRSQWWVLAFISRNDGLPQTQLANELEVGKVALGSLIDRLQAAGFVKRVPDKTDRRIKRVHLTAKAQKLLDDIAPVSEAFTEKIIAGISKRDLEVTARTLYAMKQNLLAMNNGNGEHSERELSSLSLVDT